MAWRQWEGQGTVGGVQIQTINGSDNPLTQALHDKDGIFTNEDRVNGEWDIRVVDLSSLAGQQLSQVDIGIGAPYAASNAFLGIADMVLISPNNAGEGVLVAPGLTSATALAGNNLPGGTYADSSVPTASGATTAATHFYVTDQVGTAQMEFAGGGWPIWRGEFTPYGHPVNNHITTNSAKFTGQERDDEAADSGNVGLDFFNARHYSSTFGRFMSPDPSGLQYATLTNPQSFNLYAYALNNPLSFIDPTGMYCEYGADDYTPENGHLEEVDYNSSVSECGGTGGMWHPDGDQTIDGIESQDSQAFANLGFSLDMSDSTPIPQLGGSAQNNAPNNGQKRTPAQCAGQALKKNAIALSLDAAGVGAGFLPGGALVVASAQATISVASGINSAVQSDGSATSATGSVLGVLGLPATFTGYAAKALGAGGRYLPYVGTIVSAAGLFTDGLSTYSDYQKCLAGG